MPDPAAAVTDENQRPGGLLEIDEAVTGDLATLLAEDARGMVLNLVADLYPADLALLLSRLELEQGQKLLTWLDPARGAEALPELDHDFRTQLLADLPATRLTVLVDALDTDDAADVLADLPEMLAVRVLPRLDDADDLNELLGYGEETAGGIMAAEYVAVPATWSVADVTEEVRRVARMVEEVYSVFVIGEGRVLEGVVSLKKLLLSPAERSIAEIMERDFISVTTNVDQEEAAQVMERYDLVSMPVLDGDGHLVGRITIDDVVDVIRSEAEEDMQLMSGVSGDESPMTSLLKVSRGRLPWLVIGLAGAGLSGLVIGGFEESLEQAVVLATFIPIVTAMGGNAAVQSAAITVQGITSGELWTGDALARVGREAVVAACNGLVLAGLLCSAVAVLGVAHAGPLALTLGLTMLFVVMLASANGALIPFGLQALGIDPASAIGPFVTTLNDILGLTVYFLIASLFYL
jgi:magnesium transporter